MKNNFNLKRRKSHTFRRFYYGLNPYDYLFSALIRLRFLRLFSFNLMV